LTEARHTSTIAVLAAVIEASGPERPTAVIPATPKAGSLVKRTSHTADTAMKIRRVTASYDRREGDRDDNDEDDNDDDRHDVSPVPHISSKGRGQHADLDLRKTKVNPMPIDNVRIPHRHSVPHSAPTSLNPTTGWQTLRIFTLPHSLCSPRPSRHANQLVWVDDLFLLITLGNLIWHICCDACCLRQGRHI
jgi:hypothetical protein